jgi:hypothetical protein
MICSQCGGEITYEPGVVFITITTREMVYGEFCIYPSETKRVIVCSEECLTKFVKATP